MQNYYTYENAKDIKMSDLYSDPNFQEDAVTFFKSSRKGYTSQDINDLVKDGDENLGKAVMEHMRFGAQGMANMWTVGKDSNWFLDDSNPEEKEARDAFARLVLAFKNTQDEKGSIEKYLDYGEAFIADPVTAVSAASIPLTGGLGAIAIKELGKAGLKKGAAALGGKSLVELAKKRLNKKILGAMAVEGGLGVGTEYLNQDIIEEASSMAGEDYERSTGAILASGGLGAATAGLGGAYFKRGAIKEFEQTEKLYREGLSVREALLKKAEEEANKVLRLNKNNKVIDASLNNLRALDKDRVAEGMDLKRLIFSEVSGSTLEGAEVLAGFDRSTLKRITAAALELSNRLEDGALDSVSDTIQGNALSKDKLGLRIIDRLANRIAAEKSSSANTPTADFVKELQDKYKLTPKQFSAIFAAEFSEAGKKLQIASAASKADNKATADVYINNLVAKLEGLDSINIALTPEEIANIDNVKSAITETRYNIIRDFNDSRIGLMTIQPATTVRNTIFGGIYIAMDAMDRVFETTLRKGLDKENIGIGQGSLDIAKRLTFNKTETEVMTALLEERFPKEMAKLFNRRGTIEGELNTYSPLSSFATKMNVFNAFSDQQFKRATLLGNLQRFLKEQNDPSIGTSLREVIKNGTWDKIDPNAFKKAVDEAYNKSFQTQFGQKGEGELSKITRDGIVLMKKTVLPTFLIPFPRFVASQATFINNYTPFRSIISPTSVEDAVTGQTSRQMTAKSITGTIALGAGILKGHMTAKEGLNWNEVKNYSDGSIQNMQANYGPLALHFYIGDLIARAQLDMNMPTPKVLIREISSLTIGADLRAVTPLQRITDAAAEGDINAIFRGMSDIVSSFTYGAAALKDIYGQLDPRSKYLPETKDATVDLVAEFSDAPDFYYSNYKRATRFLPDVPFLKGTAGQKYDALRYSPFATHPLYIKDPILKQLTGAERQPPKSALMSEMSRLRLDPYVAYRTYGEKNPFLEITTRFNLSGTLPKDAEKYIRSQKYQSFDDETKRDKLLAYIRGKTEETKAMITEYYDKASDNPELADTDENVLFYLRGEYKADVSKKDVKIINREASTYLGREVDYLDMLSQARKRQNKAEEASILMTLLKLKNALDTNNRLEIKNALSGKYK